MMKKLCYLIVLLFSQQVFGQGTWAQKTNIFTTPRAGVVGFSIGNKGYMGTGWQYSSSIVVFDDFWEWNQTSNAWTQKANFAGDARGDAVAFAIGDKGYIVTGYSNINGGLATNELWQWDQATNTWSQKAAFPGMQRYQAASFAIGLKGYVGCGYSGGLFLNDFWEYDQLTDTWTQVLDIPVGRSTCVSFSIGNLGYVCLGQNGPVLNDLWEFNPVLNIWTQKAYFPGSARAFAAGFSIGNMGYVGTGKGTSVYADFWRYDPALDLWTQMADYPHIASDIDRGSFSIGCNGYFGSGASDAGGNPTYYNDFWEYEPDTCILTNINVITNDHLKVIMSPNPFTESINISINSNEHFEIIIYDADSKRLLQQKFRNSVTLSTEQLASGIYLYELRNNNSVIKNGKIVKN